MAGTGGNEVRGLYDGFEGYRTPTEDDYRAVLTDGLTAIDSNVLLNLYRYSPQSRESLVEVLRALGDRLYIPHQVMKEFWRNRERALASPLSEVTQSVTTLRKQLDAAIEVVHMWVNRAALPSDVAEEVERALKIGFLPAFGAIQGLANSDFVEKARDTSNDAVLEMLEPVLLGHVGPAMEPAVYAEAVAEGKRRASAGEPPGFGDVRKNDRDEEGAAGDYIVWEQVVLEASARSKDVLFVTGDVKQDWGRYEGSQPRGPRNELVQELMRRAGTRLFMMRPDTLLHHGGILSVDVKEESVQDVERVDRAVSDEASTTALEASKGERLSFRRAIAGLEEALAEPSIGPTAEWAARLQPVLIRVKDVFAEHVEITESPGGLYEEVMANAPRLASRTFRMSREHVDIADQINRALAGLEQVASSDDGAADDLRKDLMRLFAVLVRHRKRGLDLVYDAYHGDIGGAP